VPILTLALTLTLHFHLYTLHLPQMLNGLYAYDRAALTCDASATTASAHMSTPKLTPKHAHMRAISDRTRTRVEAGAGAGAEVPGLCLATLQVALDAMGISGGGSDTNSNSNSTATTSTTTTVIGRRPASVFVGISEMWELSILLLHTFLYQFSDSK
jgi:hypothetical protein